MRRKRQSCLFSKISVYSLKTQSSHADVKYSVTKWVSIEHHIWHLIFHLCHTSGQEAHLIHSLCSLCPTFKEIDVLVCKQYVYRETAHKVSFKMVSSIDLGIKRKFQLYCFKFFKKSAVEVWLMGISHIIYAQHFWSLLLKTLICFPRGNTESNFSGYEMFLLPVSDADSRQVGKMTKRNIRHMDKQKKKKKS